MPVFFRLHFMRSHGYMNPAHDRQAIGKPSGKISPIRAIIGSRKSFIDQRLTIARVLLDPGPEGISPARLSVSARITLT